MVAPNSAAQPPPPVVPLRWLMVVRGPRTRALDRVIFRATGFSIGCFQIALQRGERYYPSLLLTTIGRKSHQLREVLLPYREINGELVIVASLGGGPNEPEWARNLRAEPRCWVRVRRRQRPATARILTGEERAATIADIAERRKSVLGYDEKAAGHGREMAVIGLKPG
jgi:deazaflavin-dependent oxidoreductase (nitroreductase family)